jgi:anthranilate synthase component 1
MLFGELVIFDHIHKTVAVVANADTHGRSAREAYDEACARVDALAAKLRAPMELPNYDMPARTSATVDYRSNFSRADFMAAVSRCKEYIRAGDVIQVVLSQRLETPIRVTPMDIYRALRIINPSPYMFYLDTDDVHLVGSSPEVMVKVAGGDVVVRPIAGTRRRGRTEQEDRALEEELLADPKERAEHIMLVDLGRNDVGRVSRYGSVVVDE